MRGSKPAVDQEPTKGSREWAFPAGQGSSARRRRPRVVFLADKRNWAFDFVARSIASRVAGRFRTRVLYAQEKPELDPRKLDLLYVFFWGERWPERFGIEPGRMIREVASHRWARDEVYGRCTPQGLADRYLKDCRFVTTPARRLHEMLKPVRDDVFLMPNGVETCLFRPGRRRTGPMRVGWAGDPGDEIKGLHDILIPACSGRFDLRYTSSKMSRLPLARFYSEIDVLAVASESEGQPLPLMESMAAGCFPVTTDVGIVPELVRTNANGIVVERSVSAFREALGWCEANLDRVRAAGSVNARLIRRTRPWDLCASRFGDLFDYAIALREASTAERPSDAPGDNLTAWISELETPASGVREPGRRPWDAPRDAVRRARWIMDDKRVELGVASRTGRGKSSPRRLGRKLKSMFPLRSRVPAGAEGAGTDD